MALSVEQIINEMEYSFGRLFYDTNRFKMSIKSSESEVCLGLSCTLFSDGTWPVPVSDYCRHRQEQGVRAEFDLRVTKSWDVHDSWTAYLPESYIVGWEEASRLRSGEPYLRAETDTRFTEFKVHNLSDLRNYLGMARQFYFDDYSHVHDFTCVDLDCKCLKAFEGSPLSCNEGRELVMRTRGTSVSWGGKQIPVSEYSLVSRKKNGLLSKKEYIMPARIRMYSDNWWAFTFYGVTMHMAYNLVEMKRVVRRFMATRLPWKPESDVLLKAVDEENGQEYLCEYVEGHGWTTGYGGYYETPVDAIERLEDSVLLVGDVA